MQDTLQADPLEIEEISGTEPATEKPSAELLQMRLTHLHILRHQRATVNETIDKVLVRIREINKALFDRESELSDEIKAAEESVKSVALALFAVNGDKHPAPGVNIKEFATYIYDAAQALEYAKAEARICVIPESLDKKLFESTVCKSKKTLPAFVVAGSRPRADIDKDLSKIFGEASK